LRLSRPRSLWQSIAFSIASVRVESEFASLTELTALGARTLTQHMVHEHDAQQRLDNGGGAYADTGIVAPQGAHFDGLARAIDRTAQDPYAGGRLDGDRYPDILP